MEDRADATIRPVVNSGVELRVTDRVMLLPPEILVVKRVILVQFFQIVR